MRNIFFTALITTIAFSTALADGPKSPEDKHVKADVIVTDAELSRLLEVGGEVGVEGSYTDIITTDKDGKHRHHVRCLSAEQTCYTFDIDTLGGGTITVTGYNTWGVEIFSTEVTEYEHTMGELEGWITITL